MKSRFVHNITCTSPVKTEEGTVRISISDKSNRNARSKYPLHDELIKRYRQSNQYKDFIAEGRDACTDPNIFEIDGVAKKKAGSDLIDDHPIELERALRLFSSPVEAFRVAQIWSRARRVKKERFGRAFRELFMEKLETLVPAECAEGWAGCNRVTRLRALDAFLGASASLLKQWKKAGKVAVRWWIENPRDVHRMQHAQERLQHVYTTNLHVSSMCKSMPWKTALSPKQAQLDPDFDFVPLALLGTDYLIDQHSIREAARSASYLVFRQFMLQKIKVHFCAWCGGVYEYGKKTRYCCAYCARSYTSKKSKSKGRARLNKERVVTGVEILKYWLERADTSTRTPWRTHLENELRDHDLIDANRQASQIIGQWVNAAHSRNESHRRKRLVKLCTRSRFSSIEGAKTTRMVDTLLVLIERAEATGKQQGVPGELFCHDLSLI